MLDYVTINLMFIDLLSSASIYCKHGSKQHEYGSGHTRAAWGVEWLSTVEAIFLPPLRKRQILPGEHPLQAFTVGTCLLWMLRCRHSKNGAANRAYPWLSGGRKSESSRSSRPVAQRDTIKCERTSVRSTSETWSCMVASIGGALYPIEQPSHNSLLATFSDLSRAYTPMTRNIPEFGYFFS